ncbi:LysR family transcriptional regulator [Luteimicrobium subarcticum]|uniref:DNA-binding transcriptional LysR family regulator n=1 Tax=Luteimicrobium subarcticum TaxID=620910 RepID=A0A2M8WJS9_9MICO|nr:LysR family transcriptional regulator [Luteimicrobium subarcticum]PJI91146.1 DNA-binding transcriptional LysR family regulator [Luteimicrobium subarcticum]
MPPISRADADLPDRAQRVRRVTQLANLDLNLLVALDALLQNQGVTKAAVQMGLSQPALSASLARLRRHFDDPLLSRRGNEYFLTPLALQLRERTRTVLAGVERVFAAEPVFDPATSSREVSVVASDYSVAMLGARVAEILHREAPGMRLRFAANTPSIVDDAAHALLGTDLILLPHGFITDMPHADLHEDRWTCLVAETSTEVGDELTHEQLRTMPWVMTFHSPTASTPAARRLRMAGFEPRIEVVTEHFLTIPALVAGSSRVGLFQERLARALPAAAGVRAVRAPVDLGTLVEAMWWHPANDRDPEHEYVRDVFRRAAQESSG